MQKRPVDSSQISKYYMADSKKASSEDLLCGTLYGIGVGPGDPELITLKALNCLRAAPVIAFPAGIGGQPGVAERSISQWISPQQQCVPLAFPYVREPEQLAAAWEKAARTIRPYLKTGNVVFACEGDISFYSTFTYLAQSVKAIDASVKVEAIAGISSPMAAAAALGIPLTCQAEKLVILPALYTVEQLDFLLTWAEVVVLMKVSSVYEKVWQVLAKHQLLESSYVVERASQENQKIYKGLQSYPTLKLPYFSIMIIKTE